MVYCSVFGCDNTTEVISDQSVQYYYLPKEPVAAHQWLNACIWKDQFDTNSARVCSIHFTPECYTSDYIMMDYNGTYTKMLKDGAIPTLHLSLPSSIVKTIDATHADYIYDPTTDQTIANLDAPNYNIKLEPLPIIKGEEIVDEKYKHINLHQLRRENMDLKIQAEARLDTLITLKEKYNKSINLYKIICHNFKQKNIIRNKLRRQTIGNHDQLNLLKKVFSESQIKLLTGKKKIYWSDDDMAVAHTIRHMSNKRCYTHLSKTLNIPLPGLSSIKRWTSLKKGECENTKDEDKSNELVKVDDSE